MGWQIIRYVARLYLYSNETHVLQKSRQSGPQNKSLSLAAPITTKYCFCAVSYNYILVILIINWFQLSYIFSDSLVSNIHRFHLRMCLLPATTLKTLQILNKLLNNVLIINFWKYQYGDLDYKIEKRKTRGQKRSRMSVNRKF